MMRVRRWRQGVWLPLLVGALLLTLVLALLLAKFMTRSLNHDEHQFVASGVLLARQQLLPYLDYAYFHVPLLVLVYSWLFQYTDYFLLTARGFSTLCSWWLLLTLFWVTLRLLRDEGRWTRLAVASAGVLLLTAAPIFIYTSGRAWNHDLPVLLTVWAVLAHVAGLTPGRRQGWLWLSGLLVGLACATRSSFAPLLLPLGLAIWLWPPPQPIRTRLRGSLLFALGVLVGVVPVLLFWYADPANFLFGNLDYPRVNTLYRETIGYDRRMTLAAKLSSFVLDLLVREPGNLLILALYLWLGRPRRTDPPQTQAWLRLLAGCVLALTLGALAPTPSWPQYFYAFFPLMLLGALFGLAHGHRALLAQRPFRLSVGFALLIAVLLTAKEYEHLPKVLRPASWYPVELHHLGAEMRALTGPNPRLLTLAPILPLEGGAAIYPQLATGPFALRAASFIEETGETPLHLVDVSRLDSWLEPQPPPAVLTNVHLNQAPDEAPLLDYARRHAYTPLTFDDGETLWLAARARWDEAIQLVTVAGLPPQVAAGATITPVFFLENMAPLANNVTVNVRLVNQTGQTVAQSSGWPWGRPTSTWQAHELWYDGHPLTIPPETAPGLHRIELEFYDPTADRFLPATDLRRQLPLESAFVVDYLVVGDWPATLATRLDPTPIFADALTLAAYTMDAPTPPQAGGTLRIQLGWEMVRPLAGDYTAFVHLVSAAGQLVAQQDKPPLAGFYPTSRWQPGRGIADEFTLTLPPDLPPGEYTLYTGFYDLASGERLPVTTRQPLPGLWQVLAERLGPGAAQETGGAADAWRLTTIQVEAP